MDLRFIPLAEWEALAERRIAVKEPRIAVKDASGREVLSISPGLGVHRDLTVPGNDWLPVRPGGVSVLEQMAHNPQQFLGKVRNIADAGGHYVLLPVPRRVDARALLVGDSRNYYHWLIDHLPRLLLARRYGELEGRQAIVGPDLPRFVEDSLSMLGIDASRRLVVQADEAVTVADACVPNMLASMTVCHPIVPALLREAFPAPPPGRRRRIYLSRQDAGTRRLDNEPELVALLERHGFERHVPSAMSFAEQVAVCSQAEAIVAVHGAALANMLFCAPGTKVLEIFSPAHRASFFSSLARMCRLAHVFVPAALVDARKDLSPLHHPQWRADLQAMEAALSGPA